MSQPFLDDQCRSPALDETGGAGVPKDVWNHVDVVRHQLSCLGPGLVSVPERDDHLLGSAQISVPTLYRRILSGPCAAKVSHTGPACSAHCWQPGSLRLRFQFKFPSTPAIRSAPNSPCTDAKSTIQPTSGSSRLASTQCTACTASNCLSRRHADHAPTSASAYRTSSTAVRRRPGPRNI